MELRFGQLIHLILEILYRPPKSDLSLTFLKNKTKTLTFHIKGDTSGLQATLIFRFTFVHSRIL